ncbi:MAG: hypothetical protein H6560_20965 [Lewinellaceae bacterium]|nr:hypothetical protein [Lewinellaceae bacterium]
MVKTITLYRPGFLAFIFLFLLGCNKDDPGGSLLQLNFDHTVGGVELNLNDTWYNSAAGHPFMVERLKYYTSNFALQNAEGELVEVREVHYRDAEKPDTRTFEWMEVPPGEYTALSFVFGLDETVNVHGGLPNTTTNINMEWPLPGEEGYHYMKFEGRYNANGAGDIKPFNLHTGPTGNNKNYIRVSLPFSQPVKLSGGTWQLNLSMDLSEWLQNPNVYDFEAFGAMIMANQNAQQVLHENGSNVFSIRKIEKE